LGADDEPRAVDCKALRPLSERRVGKAVLVFRFENPDKAEQVLKVNGVNVLRDVELFRHA
jgi:hypothetical protein